MDLVFLAAIGGAALLTWGLIALCQRLQSPPGR